MEKPEHNKQEYPPMHTVEHILNQTMVQLFGCKRSMNTHIERKKSKCDYELENAPTETQIIQIEQKVNETIKRNLPVLETFVEREALPKQVDPRKLPETATRKIRLVTIGDYDICACIGAHVSNTSEIGQFKIISSDFENGRWRVRFKLLQ